MLSTIASAGTEASSDARVQEEAAAWFARMHGDAVSTEDRTAFTTWLEADERHRREYDLLEQLWDASARLQPRASRRRRPRATAIGLAGIALLCGWLVWTSLGMDVATEAGDRQYAMLADGSELHIAPNTRLRVSYGLLSRQLTLEQGCIVVTVAADRLRSFEVAAGRGIVRDIGTRFEVCTNPQWTRVTVAEGMVEIDLPSSGSTPRKVGAGESAEYDDTNVSSAQPVDAVAAMAWTKGQLMFDATRLPDVVTALNRYRKTPIILADASLDAIRISGVFLIGNDARALRALEKVAPITFADEGTRIVARRSTRP